MRADFSSHQSLSADPTPSTAPAIPTPTSALHRVRPTLPDVKEFSGDRREFRTWRVHIREKLAIDGPTYPTDQAKFAYISSRLTGAAAAWVQPLVEESHEVGTYDWGRLMQRVEEGFLDQHSQENALRRLQALKQKPKSTYSSFLSTYERALSEAGVVLTGNKEASRLWVMSFSNALQRDLKDSITLNAIQLHPLTTDWKRWTSQVGLLAGAMENKRNGTRDWPSPTRGHSHTHQRPSNNNMDWEPTPAKKAQVKKERRAKWVSPEVVDERFEKGLCIRCGASGHLQRGCPYKKAIRPSARQSPFPKAMKAQPEVPPMLEGDEAEETDSEKSEKE